MCSFILWNLTKVILDMNNDAYLVGSTHTEREQEHARVRVLQRDKIQTILLTLCSEWHW